MLNTVMKGVTKTHLANNNNGNKLLWWQLQKERKNHKTLAKTRLNEKKKNHGYLKLTINKGFRSKIKKIYSVISGSTIVGSGCGGRKEEEERKKKEMGGEKGFCPFLGRELPTDTFRR